MLDRRSYVPIREEAKLKRQIRLLRDVERSGETLAAAIERIGWTYDDLIYENHKARQWSGIEPMTLTELRIPATNIPMVSFFTGCGGMDLGLEAVGFKHVAAFEINELFCKTLRHNRPHWKVFGPPIHSGDVSKFEDVSEAVGGLISSPFEGLFVGGPPCQPFSIAANQRFAKSGDNFKRTGFQHEKNGNLFFDFVRLIIAFRPKAFIIENVPGLRDLDDGEQLSMAVADLKRAGYVVEEPFILNAANFRVPQQRLRLFVVGARIGAKFRKPKPALSLVGAGSVLYAGKERDLNGETRAHKAESIMRYMQLDYGQRDQLGRVDRLDPVLPSKTVIAGGAHGGGRSHLHPEVPRTLSVRECARLQTFPDDYAFVGATARQFTQVGNAVPPVLAAQLGKSILKSFF